MTTIKSWTTGLFGLTCTVFGIWLRLRARDLAWPIEWSYSGSREDTIWAIRERAYKDVSLAIVGFGLLILLLVLAHWLWTPPLNSKQERQA
jgi:hypothetical protein